MERAAAARTQAQFLCPLLEVGGVAQVGRQEDDVGIDPERRDEWRDSDRRGERGGVAADQDVTFDVTRDRGQLDPAEINRRDEVSKEGLVLELFW